jgi:uncharacterized lipoprotein YmbA
MSRLHHWIAAGLLCMIAGCAAPALSLYTLGVASNGHQAAPLGAKPLVIEVARVSLPDEIDNEDILTRSDRVLIRSATGRWASRLSLQVTDRLTARLAERRPDALVVGRAQAQTPSYRVVINIGRLDIGQDGSATLDADWQIIPGDPTSPPLRDRGHYTVQGPAANDQQIAGLTGSVLDQLAAAINLARLR